MFARSSAVQPWPQRIVAVSPGTTRSSTKVNAEITMAMIGTKMSRRTAKRHTAGLAPAEGAIDPGAAVEETVGALAGGPALVPVPARGEVDAGVEVEHGAPLADDQPLRLAHFLDASVDVQLQRGRVRGGDHLVVEEAHVVAAARVVQRADRRLVGIEAERQVGVFVRELREEGEVEVAL